MKKPHAFGSVLLRLRREQGFPNAHSFYKARDGRRSLRLSFPNYLALERGLSLPKPPRVPALAKALGLAEGSASWREFVRSYLACLFGTDSLYAGLADASGPPAQLTDELARQSTRQRAAQLDLAQWKVLAADPTAYYCHVYLINTPGWSEPADVAAAVSLPAARVSASLKALAAAGIVQVSGSGAKSPFAYKCLQTLPALPELLHVRMPIMKAREAFAGKRGRLLHRRNVTTRMTKAALDRCFARLAEAVTFVGACGNAEKADDTDVFFFDARVFRVFD